MPYTLYIHLIGDPPLLVDVEELPKTTDTIIVGKNPRTRDGKDYGNILSEVTTVLFPIARITFVEVLPSEEEPTLLPFRESRG